MTAQERIAKAQDGFEKFESELFRLDEAKALSQVVCEEVELNGARKALLEPVTNVLNRYIVENVGQLTAIFKDLHNTLYGKE